MCHHDELHALRKVCLAAEVLLAAREGDMLTTDEWDALAHAVHAASYPRASSSGGGGGESSNVRDQTFRIEDDLLIRRVHPARGRGKPCEHTCERATFEAVAHAIDGMNAKCFTIEDVRLAVGKSVPWTQVAVAVAFLKERGCIIPSVRRKQVAATRDVHLDAMTEWSALRENAPAPGS